MLIIGNRQETINQGLTNQQQMQKIHLRQVFDVVLKNKRVSRSRLARKLGLSAPAISALVDILQEQGALVNSGLGVHKAAGRRPVMVEVNKNYHQIITFGLNLKEIDYVLYDFTCGVLEKRRLRISGNDYIHYLKKLMEESEILDMNKVQAVCVSVPAIADSLRHRLLLNVLDIADDKKFLHELGELCPGAMHLVSNDAAAFAYAEKEFSEEVDQGNLIYINHSYGVGAGIIINGEVFNGACGSPGEIGHMSIDMNGPQCVCGNKGCLEKMIGLSTILREIRSKVEEGGFSVISQMVEGDLENLDIEIVADALKQKDLLVTEVIRDVAYKLSIGIKNIISIFNPQEIVIGGDAHKFGDTFLDMVLQNMNGMEAWTLSDDVNIRYTRIDEYGANLGLAKYFLDNLLEFNKVAEDK